MPRPVSRIRAQVLGVFDHVQRASAYSVAAQTGVPFVKAREVCQNARRAGHLRPVATERVPGSDRPAVVYERVQSGEHARQAELPWFAGLNSMFQG